MKLLQGEVPDMAPHTRVALGALAVGLLLVLSSGGLLLHLHTAGLTARLGLVEEELRLLRHFVHGPQVGRGHRRTKHRLLAIIVLLNDSWWG